ncbi:MAG: hypothetical protein WAX85_00630 [Minisyncoccia bacterium]
MKDLLFRKMLEAKMKGVPQADQDKVFTMSEKNPDLFQKIALEIQEEIKKGVDQMTATMNIVKKYKTDLKGLI